MQRKVSTTAELGTVVKRGVEEWLQDVKMTKFSVLTRERRKKKRGRVKKERCILSSVVAKGFLYQSSLGLCGKALTEKKYFMI